MAVVTEQLWGLLCSLVQSNFEVLLETIEAQKPEAERNNRKKGSPTMTWADRFQNYYSLAEDVLANYRDKAVGAHILGYFYLDDDDDKPNWPPSVFRKFTAIKDKAQREYKKWMLKGGKKYFTNDDRRKLNEQCKIMVFVGHKIHEWIEDAGTMANTHINKHWPYEFQSGQSPSGIITCLY